jgi:hypothetical protein
MAGEDDPDELLRIAFATNASNANKDFFSLGPLSAFATLFPDLFAGTSLGTLGSLLSKSRVASTSPTVPGLHVQLGVRRIREKLLYSFFDSILEFQSPKDFAKVLSNGFSIAVIGGLHEEIVAAVVFIVTKHGIFIDAIAVANGHSPGACLLSSKTFLVAGAEQDAMMRNVVEKSF